MDFSLLGLWHQMGVTLSAAGSIEWLSQVLKEKPGELTGALGSDLKAPGRLLFLPYLSGERTPHNDASIRGAFAGLGHESDRVALTQAVLEGVSFAIRDSLEALRLAGTTLTRVTAIGNDLKLDNGIGTCGKNGQGVPVGVGQPTVCIERVTVGGTKS